LHRAKQTDKEEEGKVAYPFFDFHSFNTLA
jgi:hypothetical protein